jgi:hypothetical protein
MNRSLLYIGSVVGVSLTMLHFNSNIHRRVGRHHVAAALCRLLHVLLLGVGRQRERRWQGGQGEQQEVHGHGMCGVTCATCVRALIKLNPDAPQLTWPPIQPNPHSRTTTTTTGEEGHHARRLRRHSRDHSNRCHRQRHPHVRAQLDITLYHTMMLACVGCPNNENGRTFHNHPPNVHRTPHTQHGRAV